MKPIDIGPALDSDLERRTDGRTPQEIAIKERFYDAQTRELLHYDRAPGDDPGTDVHGVRLPDDSVSMAPLPNVQIYRRGVWLTRENVRRAALLTLRVAIAPVVLPLLVICFVLAFVVSPHD